MDKSLLRISSGKRILTAADDSGGLSVAMKLQNQINTTKAAQGRVENSKSFVEMQDTALSTAGDILIEMSSVKANYVLREINPHLLLKLMPLSFVNYRCSSVA